MNDKNSDQDQKTHLLADEKIQQIKNQSRQQFPEDSTVVIKQTSSQIFQIPDENPQNKLNKTLTAGLVESQYTQQIIESQVTAGLSDQYAKKPDISENLYNYPETLQSTTQQQQQDQQQSTQLEQAKFFGQSIQQEEQKEEAPLNPMANSPYYQDHQNNNNITSNNAPNNPYEFTQQQQSQQYQRFQQNSMATQNNNNVPNPLGQDEQFAQFYGGNQNYSNQQQQQFQNQNNQGFDNNNNYQPPQYDQNYQYPRRNQMERFEIEHQPDRSSSASSQQGITLSNETKNYLLMGSMGCIFLAIFVILFSD